MKTFTKNIATTFITQFAILIIGITTSIIVARVLGPEGKGIYSLAILLPTLIATFTQLGIAPATVYHTARGKYDRKIIFGNNILLSLGIGLLSLIVGLILIFFFLDSILPGLPIGLALLGLTIIPFMLSLEILQRIFIGMQRIMQANILSATYFSLNFSLILIALLGYRSGVSGVLLASIASLIIANLLVIFWLYRSLGGVSFSINFTYIKSVLSYGVKTHLGTIVNFLNLRTDIFLVNFFLNPVAVGFYSVSVNIAEKLWLLSQTSRTVLFPKIAAERNEQRRKEITPVLARTIFIITSLGAIILFFIIQMIIVLLYSTDFLSSVRPLQILLPGIVVAGVSQILAVDISGRGKPLVNSSVSSIALIVNILLNIIWIPKFGIEGAAWATTVSYTFTFIGRVLLYSRISGNSLTVILLPQRSDLVLYKKLWGLSRDKIRSILPF